MVLQFAKVLYSFNTLQGGGKLRYLFRDDGFRLWRALERFFYKRYLRKGILCQFYQRYVYGVVWRIYSTDGQVNTHHIGGKKEWTVDIHFGFLITVFCKKVLSDLRLQSWALAISEEGGLSGFPRSIHTRELLARSIILFFMNIKYFCGQDIVKYLQGAYDGDIWGVCSSPRPQCPPLPVLVCPAQAHQPFKVLSCDYCLSKC